MLSNKRAANLIQILNFSRSTNTCLIFVHTYYITVKKNVYVEFVSYILTKDCFIKTDTTAY